MGNIGKHIGLCLYRRSCLLLPPVIVLRGAIVNRTYGIHKNYMFNNFYYQYLVLLTIAPRSSSVLYNNVRGKTVGDRRIGYDWMKKRQAMSDLCS